MTDHPDTILQRRMMAQADEIHELKAQLAAALDKAYKKQRAAKALSKQRKEAEAAIEGETPIETVLQNIIARQQDQIHQLNDDVRHLKAERSKWQGKAKKAGGEVARLTAENERLRADRRNLTFDINKTRKHVEQLQERVQ